MWFQVINEYIMCWCRWVSCVAVINVTPELRGTLTNEHRPRIWSQCPLGREPPSPCHTSHDANMLRSSSHSACYWTTWLSSNTVTASCSHTSSQNSSVAQNCNWTLDLSEGNQAGRVADTRKRYVRLDIFLSWRVCCTADSAPASLEVLDVHRATARNTRHTHSGVYGE